jgi:aquaporin TIP
LKWSNFYVTKNFFSSVTSNFRAYLAEFLGTFVLVAVSLGIAASDNLYGNVGALGLAAGTGLIYVSMVFATVHLSGGHLNPAITLSLWLVKKVNSADMIFYLAAQFLAGFAACLFLIFIFGRSADFSLGFETLKEGFSVQNAVLVEALGTAVLVFAYFATLVDRRGPGSFAPLVLGLVILSFSLFGATISGGFANPAIAVGPAVFSQSYSELSAWIIGPFTGSLFGIIYEFLFVKKPQTRH